MRKVREGLETAIVVSFLFFFGACYLARGVWQLVWRKEEKQLSGSEQWEVWRARKGWTA